MLESLSSGGEGYVAVVNDVGDEVPVAPRTVRCAWLKASLYEAALKVFQSYDLWKTLASVCCNRGPARQSATQEEMAVGRLVEVPLDYPTSGDSGAVARESISFFLTLLSTSRRTTRRRG